ncbi:PREDICTED: NXPE family member 4-like [Nanorana parkeri]|uniref:NXPE family member 4-like n=1 Tax=Nanorana parkeri TaxID=125878 RepID=UPI000854D47A|nr:PREDICTED: NXPE family member 4-like [Nanorana parkeri]
MRNWQRHFWIQSAGLSLRIEPMPPPCPPEVTCGYRFLRGPGFYQNNGTHHQDGQLQDSYIMLFLKQNTPTNEVAFYNPITPSEDELTVFNKMSELVPKVTFTNVNYTTSAKNSRATIFEPRKTYCVGDILIVQIDMFDRLGNKKTYGGDFIKARISSPNLKAAASGRVEDFSNGTYHVHFTLFWEGKVYVSLVLYHPSEAVSVLWRVRNRDYGLIDFIGTFQNGTRQVKTECGFKLKRTNDVCEYRYNEDMESFYCKKPRDVHCESLTILQSHNRNISFLSEEEKSLFKRQNIGVNIPADFGPLKVSTCSKFSSHLQPCTIGMKSLFPSGFVFKNMWRPAFCEILNFSTQEKIYTCLQDKMVHILGDSTLRQWFYSLTSIVKGFRNFNLQRQGLISLLFAVNEKNNIQLLWKKHSHPFVASRFYTVKDDAYMSQEIDRLAGGPHYVLVICLGQHFRPFPILLFIRRVLNVHRAVQRLFSRSPDTKVIIKAENTREISEDAERFSDFHGYIQYLIVKDVFSDLPVAVVDAWDMSIAYNTNNVHLPELVIKNQILMFLTYVC